MGRESIEQMTTWALVQARVESTRYPGKVMLEAAGKPLLGHLLSRLKSCKELDGVAVLTTVHKSDNAIAAYCRSIGVPVYRGKVNDVLDRYYQGAKLYGASTIVRVTGDCPLVAPEWVDTLVQHFRMGNYDHAQLRDFPDGLDAGVFNFAALEEAHREAKSRYEREHVEPFIVNRPLRYRLSAVTPPYTGDVFQYRWTVDEPNDFKVVAAMLECLHDPERHFTLDDMILWALKNQDLATENKTVPRNEGLWSSLDAEGRKPTPEEMVAYRLDDKARNRRGFALMDKATRRDVSSRGGKKAQAMGKGHRWSQEEAQAMARKPRKKAGR